MRPLRAARLEGPQRDEHDFDALYVGPASLEIIPTILGDFDDWHDLTVPFQHDFGGTREIIPTILGDRPDFDVFYVVPAGRLAARTRSTAGQRFAGARPWRRPVPIEGFIAVELDFP